ERLAPRPEPYWRGIDTGAAIGYRRTTGGGFWLARVMIEGRYRKGALGRSDDTIKPDGASVLDYRQAEAKAREWAARQHRQAAGQEPERAGPYTVADAIRDYMAAYQLRGGKAVAATRQAIGGHILPQLGAIRLDRLTR